MNFRNVADLNACILDNIGVIPKDIDLVVGIPRSGLLAANLIALHLNLPLADIDGFLRGQIFQMSFNRKPSERMTGRRIAKALIVDDSLCSGREMQRTLQRISRSELTCEIVTLVVYVVPEQRQNVDIAFEMCQLPRIFEWNLMHHGSLVNACVDIDGVLCRDPTDDENDDGEQYIHFLKSAEPYLLPTLPVGYLVTCRLEKYRGETEAWLHEHHVKYRELIMMDMPDKAARIKSGSHGRFKAIVYDKTNASLFIESNIDQAFEISNRSCKPVVCIESRSLVLPSLDSIGKKLLRKVLRSGKYLTTSLSTRLKHKLLERTVDYYR